MMSVSVMSASSIDRGGCVWMGGLFFMGYY